DDHTEQFAKKKKYYASFYNNLWDGITYYRQLPGLSGKRRKRFDKALYYAGIELDSLNYRYAIYDKQ
ncbi:MAG: hypothetical protein JJE22_10880, partial [Bacteroidia bacterium]|nr:hypothetical protein [Bacteroidia bacterium]